MENDLADSTERQLDLNEVQDHHAYTFKSVGCLKYATGRSKAQRLNTHKTALTTLKFTGPVAAKPRRDEIDLAESTDLR